MRDTAEKKMVINIHYTNGGQVYPTRRCYAAYKSIPHTKNPPARAVKLCAGGTNAQFLHNLRPMASDDVMYIKHMGNRLICRDSDHVGYFASSLSEEEN